MDQSFRLGVVKHWATGALVDISLQKSIKEMGLEECLHSSACQPAAVMGVVENFYPIFVKNHGRGLSVLNKSAMNSIRSRSKNISFVDYFAKNYGGVLFLDSVMLMTDRTPNNCFVDASGFFFAMDNGSGFCREKECRKQDYTTKTPLQMLFDSGYRYCTSLFWGGELEAHAFSVALKRIACILQKYNLAVGQLSVLLDNDPLLMGNKAREVGRFRDLYSCWTKHTQHRSTVFEANVGNFSVEKYTTFSMTGECVVDFQKLALDFIQFRVQKLAEELNKRGLMNTSCPVSPVRL